MKSVIIIIVGVGAIAGLEFKALSMGINGSLLALSFAAIGGIVGFGFGKAKDFLNTFLKRN